MNEEINKLCQNCQLDCKQSAIIIIVKCNNYTTKKDGKQNGNNTNIRRAGNRDVERN
jgi:hypothetical protein